MSPDDHISDIVFRRRVLATLSEIKMALAVHSRQLQELKDEQKDHVAFTASQFARTHSDITDLKGRVADAEDTSRNVALTATKIDTVLVTEEKARARLSQWLIPIITAILGCVLTAIVTLLLRH